MKTILFILIMWLVVRSLRRGRTGFPSEPGQSRPFPVPEPVEEDAPLPGPWSRPLPPELQKPEEVAVEADKPLPGPWSKPAPVEGQKPEEVAAEAGVPLPGSWNRPIPPEVKREKEPAAAEDFVSGRLEETCPAAQKVVQAVCTGQGVKRKQRCRKQHPVEALFNRNSLVAGIIMSEILGPPGGHRRHKGLGMAGRR